MEKTTQLFEVNADYGIRKYTSRIEIIGDNVNLTGYEDVSKEESVTTGAVPKENIATISYSGKKIMSVPFKIRIGIFGLVALLGLFSTFELVYGGILGMFLSYFCTKKVETMIITFKGGRNIYIPYSKVEDVEEIEGKLK